MTTDKLPPLTAEEIAKLREAAEKATPGPWFANDWNQDDGPSPTTIEAHEPEEVGPGQRGIWPGRVRCIPIADSREGDNPLPDAAYIALCDPDTIKRLIAAAESTAAKDAEIAELRQRAEKAEADARRLWGVVHNIKGKRDRTRWAAVRDAIGCGSQAAMELCRRFDTDPDATWHPTRGWQADAASQPAAEGGTKEQE